MRLTPAPLAAAAPAAPAVLGEGSVPLDLLESQMDGSITGKAR